MFLIAVLLATAIGGGQKEEELPNSGKGKTVAHLPGHLHDQLPDHQPDQLPPTSTQPFLPSSSLSNFSAQPQYQTPPPPFTIPSVISAPATPSDEDVKGYRVAVLVLSGPKNFGKRRKLRELTLPGFRLTFIFLVGRKTSNLDQLLKQEASQQNDILHMDMEESYANLPTKTLAGLDFVLQGMPEYDLFLKLDDDLEISSEKLSRALLHEQPWAPSTLYCFPLTRVPPYRQSRGRNAKMFVPTSTYPPSIYPDYCLGWLVAMLPQTAALLLSRVDSAPAVHIDDVYITGILRQETNVSLSMLSTNPLLHTSLFRDVLAHCRFLSWAIHVFAYDLAYEPDGWPWRPIEFFVEHIQELALSEISDSDPNSVACLHSFLLQHLFFAIILLNVIILLFHSAFLHWLKH